MNGRHAVRGTDWIPLWQRFAMAGALTVVVTFFYLLSMSAANAAEFNDEAVLDTSQVVTANESQVLSMMVLANESIGYDLAVEWWDAPDWTWSL